MKQIQLGNTNWDTSSLGVADSYQRQSPRVYSFCCPWGCWGFTLPQAWLLDSPLASVTASSMLPINTLFTAALLKLFNVRLDSIAGNQKNRNQYTFIFSDPLRKLAWNSPFYRLGRWVSERLSNLPRAIELISSRTDTPTPKPGHFLLYHSLLNDLKETHAMYWPQSEEAENR